MDAMVAGGRAGTGDPLLPGHIDLMLGILDLGLFSGALLKK